MPDPTRLPNWPRAMAEDLAASYVGISATLLRQEVEAGRAPKPIRITTRRNVWLRDDLDAYLERIAGRNAPVMASAPEHKAWKPAGKKNGGGVGGSTLR